MSETNYYLQNETNYLDLMSKIWGKGEERSDRTGVGTRSLFGEQLKFDLKRGFPLLTTKKVHTKSILTELEWFLKGRTDNQWLVDHGCTIWSDWSGAEECAKFGRQEGDLGPVYGHQWRNFGERTWIDRFDAIAPQTLYGVDQIAQVIESIKNNPMSRRHIVTAWNPLEADRVTLPPCHSLFQFYVGKNGLSCHMYQRSADYFLGVPFNIASYAFLTHLIGQVCDLAADTLTISFGDVHLYLNHEEQVHEQLVRIPRKPPTVTLQPITDIDEFEASMFEVHDYDPFPAIKAPVAV